MDKPCFFMVCTDSTEKESIEKNLLGDRELMFQYMKTIKKGDVGFLINIFKNELIGIFVAESGAQLDIDPKAFGGNFRAQVKVKLVGELQRISNASDKLKNFLELREITTKNEFSFFIPKMKTYGPDITEKVLSLFKITPEFESLLPESKFSDSPEFSLEDVAGLNEIKSFIYQRIIAPFEDEELAYDLGLKIGGGIFLYGPPGTGKTLISSAIAKSIAAKFIEISPSIIMGYPGEAEKKLENVFYVLEKEPRAVLFLDEAEWILSHKRGEGSTVMMRVIPLLLSLLSKIFKDKRKPIIVIAATNKPWSIDSAFLRPGRFDRIFYVGLPDEQARMEIIKIHLKNRKYNLTENDIIDLAKSLEGYSGADIENLIDEAAFMAFEKRDIIEKKYIEEALLKIRKSVSAEELKKIEDWAANQNFLK